MFDSLNDKMNQDERAESTPRQRGILYVAVLLVSVVLFGGLYLGIRFLE